MGALRRFNNLSNVDASDFQRFCAAFVDSLVDQFNGGIQFVTNIRAMGAGDKDSPSLPLQISLIAATDTKIAHTLGVIPNGILVVKIDTDDVIFAPAGTSTAWTTTNIWLRTNSNVNASIYII